MNNNGKAKYRTGELPEYQGNPLIEALPSILDDREVLKKLKIYQTCSLEEKKLPAHLRKKLLCRLNGFVEPFISYIDVFRAIEDAVLEGYTTKNPFSPTTQHYLHYLNNEDTPVSPATGSFISRGTAVSIIGASGAGKSYMIERILDTYPQVIHHKEYNGKKLKFDQIVWLKINCPENTLLSTFATIILDELDRITGSDDASLTYSSKMNIGKALVQVERRLRFSFVGIIVIDEFQNLNVGNKKLRQQFLNFVIKLVDRSGIPVVFCGNPEIIDIFRETLRNARRAESGGVFVIDALSAGEWRLFVDQLWKLQWTNIATELTDELSDCLYELSTGLPDFAVRIYKEAQGLVIGSGEELITIHVLKDAYLKACVLSDNALSERRNIINIDSKLQYPDAHVHDEWKEVKQPVLENSNNKKKVKNIINDVCRIQHPEFQKNIIDLRNNKCEIPDGIKKDVIRCLDSNDDLLSELMGKRVVLSDPLNLS